MSVFFVDNSLNFSWFLMQRKQKAAFLLAFIHSDPYDSHALNKHPLPLRLSLNAHSIQTSRREREIQLMFRALRVYYPAVNHTDVSYAISMAVHDSQTSGLFGISLKEVGRGDGSK